MYDYDAPLTAPAPAPAPAALTTKLLPDYYWTTTGLLQLHPPSDSEGVQLPDPLSIPWI